jgi:hypothetical protein
MYLVMRVNGTKSVFPQRCRGALLADDDRQRIVPSEHSIVFLHMICLCLIAIVILKII